MVDLLTWQGLGDVVNKFRRNVLRAEELNPVWAPSLLQRAKIPYTYCWSPALIPKPPDWGAEIDISGFFFLDLANDYQPPDKLAAFLAAGPPPVYIGFGSIVVKNPAGLTKLIFDAVHKLGIRALVSEYLPLPTL
jgi:UDP:flavonoid glycosyltransferase YjiC (YdhE family)